MATVIQIRQAQVCVYDFNKIITGPEIRGKAGFKNGRQSRHVFFQTKVQVLMIINRQAFDAIIR